MKLFDYLKEIFAKNTRLEELEEKIKNYDENINKYLVKEQVFVPKGWGFERWHTNNENYCGKTLFIAKGKKTSFHVHKIKKEHMLCYSGKLLIHFSESDNIKKAYSIILNPGDVFFVPPELRHQLEGLLDTYLIEFSTTHSDEDSIRINL